MSGSWKGVRSDICRQVERLSEQNLAAYREQPLLVKEHANIEMITAQGGYGRRQIYELVQNAADAMIGITSGRIHVVFTGKELYCANEGEPFIGPGVDCILMSHLSPKRADEIGRFGLGFKSVLSISSEPQVYSRSGSFRFDSEETARRINQVVSTADRCPVLRLAYPMDPDEQAEQDPVLAELMSWAVTVVKLPLKVDPNTRLTKDIVDFPVQFLLFSPHVGSLLLDDRRAGRRRNLALTRLDDCLQLQEDGEKASWKVFYTKVAVSTEAKADAGELTGRDTLPLAWAVPLDGRATRGSFWAFFPTEYQTTLTGILNAPWKTNEDRQNLLNGDFNDFLLEAAACLVVDSLPQLVDPDDPGNVLDIIPARGREAPNWADAALTKLVYDKAVKAKSIPDQDGRLEYPARLKLHPPDLAQKALETWSAYENRPRDWCHASVDRRDRRAHAERLLLLAEQEPSSLSEWLEALVNDGTPEGSFAALQTAAVVAQTTPSALDEIRKASVLLTHTGQLVPAEPGRAFRPTAGVASSGVLLVHPGILEHPDADKVLGVLGISYVASSAQLEALLVSADFDAMSVEAWSRLWELVRHTPQPQAVELVNKHTAPNRQIYLRTLDGRFHRLHHTLLPGPIVPADGSRDLSVAIDTRFHAQELDLLDKIGAVAAPALGKASPLDPWFDRYRRDAVDAYLTQLDVRGGKPREDYLAFDDGQLAGPVEPLFSLGEEGRTRFTETLIATGAVEPAWTMRHETRSEQYPALKLESPGTWIIRKHGCFQTSLGPRPVSQAVAPALEQWQKLLPVARCSEGIALHFGLPGTLAHLDPQHWQSAFELAEELDDLRLLGAFYAAACCLMPAPARIRCHQKSGFALHPPQDILVFTDVALRPVVETLGDPFLLVLSAGDAETLEEQWHLKPADGSIQLKVYSDPSGRETPLGDWFILLDEYVPEPRRDLALVPCASLRVEFSTPLGQKADEPDLFLHENVVFFRDRLSTPDLLDRLVDLLNLQLPPGTRDAILENRRIKDIRDSLKQIREKRGLPARLLAALGADVIRSHLPEGLLAAAEQQFGQLPDREIARLALIAFGVEVLREFRDDFARIGFEPPQTWAGSHRARDFVRELGFPPEYAGFPSSSRYPLLEVDGPPDLPPPHDFQTIMIARIRELLDSRIGRRGLLSLPTGAGKTRVAVQALVEEARENGFGGPILWVAQSDELCEQAVQTWSFVWRAVGPPKPLYINRLWASNEADAIEDGTQVVVATIQKLGNLIGDDNYRWLTETACIVIDEAHLAIEKSYTELLSWLGLGRVREKDRCPIVGLTATPFKVNTEETRRLVSRYGGHRLDEGILGEDPYRALQELGVLAYVDHRLLEGADVSLDPRELDELRRLAALPASAVRRIAADSNRNASLLQSIKSLPSDWPVLLFAASVEHARIMAALLSHEGITAAAISAYTDMGARRHYIDEFRAGNTRVLANYAVLTAGFDAPSVRALYVARPTYSPVLYQQMIGRGLRGPKNGGKERCLIVNVADNILQYGEELAFRQFEHLWSDTPD